MGDDDITLPDADIYHFVLISVLGFGHTNPLLQLGRALLNAAATTKPAEQPSGAAGPVNIRITLIVTLAKKELDQLSTVQLQENDNFQLVTHTYEHEDVVSALNWCADLTDEDVIDTYGSLVANGTKSAIWPRPHLIIQDQFFFVGYVLAKHWSIPNIIFCPAPLTYSFYAQKLFRNFVLENGPAVTEATHLTSKIGQEKGADVNNLHTPRDRKQTDGKTNLCVDDFSTTTTISTETSCRLSSNHQQTDQKSLDKNITATDRTVEGVVDDEDEALQMMNRFNEVESLEIPGLGIVTKACLPKVTATKSTRRLFLRVAKTYPYASGVLANDVEATCHPELLKCRDWPRRKLNAIDDSKDQLKQPPYLDGLFEVYCVGPLCMADARLSCPDWQHGVGEGDVKVWLDKQAPASVLFACLGSWCDLCPADLVELARGLQLSGRKVIWAYRPISNGAAVTNFLELEEHEYRQPKEELDETTRLPVAFLDDTADHIIVRKWVNQPAILQHSAVGGFLTHCGWNSILEGVAIGAGKPFVCLPLAAEQCMNSLWVCRAHGAGVALWNSRYVDQLDREKISQAINEALTDRKYTDNARQLYDKFKAAIDTHASANLRKLLYRVKSHYHMRSHKT